MVFSPTGTNRVLAVVPCYNEQDCIANVVADLNKVRDQHAIPLDVLVVNDCSRDRSAEILRQLDCLHINLPVNLGIGGAMQTGYKFAQRHGYAYAVQVDGDGQHPADQLLQVLQPVMNGRADVVIGSRYLERRGFQSSALRRLGIRYFCWLNQTLTGQVVRDSTSGFRVFNRSALNLASQYYPDEYPEPEAIILFGLQNLSILEVPVQMRDRQGGVSSISAINSVYYMIKVTLGILSAYLRYQPNGKRRSL
jgi:glycosyltransferase involved in cell wall biosynthesis